MLLQRNELCPVRCAEEGASVAVEWSQNLQKGGLRVDFSGSKNVDLEVGLTHGTTVSENQAKMSNPDTHSSFDADVSKPVAPKNV